MAPPAKTAMATTRANFSGLMVFFPTADGPFSQKSASAFNQPAAAKTAWRALPPAPLAARRKSKTLRWPGRP
jgi:hypothetical protein